MNLKNLFHINSENLAVPEIHSDSFEDKILHLSSLFHFLCALILYTVSNDYIMTYLRGAKFRKIEKGDEVWT